MSSYPVRVGDGWEEVELPPPGDVPLVVPNVAAVVWRDGERSELLLQVRDKPDPARGLFELPGGRWHAGESPADAVRREVAEETGLDAEVSVEGGFTVEPQPGRPFVAARPLLVTAGIGGAYPALLVAFECVATGEPQAQPGETAEPAFRPVADVRALLRTPSLFTGPTYAILCALLGSDGGITERA